MCKKILLLRTGMDKQPKAWEIASTLQQSMHSEDTGNTRLKMKIISIG